MDRDRDDRMDGGEDAPTLLENRHDTPRLKRTFTVSSVTRRHAFDITPEVREAVLETGVAQGLVMVNCLHTTCSVLVVESSPGLFEDLARLMSRFIEDGAPYRHNDPRQSDCERGNATAHLRSSLLGPGVIIGISAGQLRLDPSHSILLAEWDGPRTRSVDVQVIGA